MAMRLYDPEDFDRELRDKWNLTPTDDYIETARKWLTPKGKSIFIPRLPSGERVPDHFLNEVIEQLSKLDELPYSRSIPLDLPVPDKE